MGEYAPRLSGESRPRIPEERSTPVMDDEEEAAPRAEVELEPRGRGEGTRASFTAMWLDAPPLGRRLRGPCEKVSS